jgi:hypothetical protein
MHDSIHAKVILGARKAIVGSANLSCNGLGLEADKTAGWEEAGILTEDPVELKSIRDWFEKIWKSAKPITNPDMNDAMKKWKERQSLFAPREHNRPLYLAIYKTSPSPKEIKRATDHLKNLQKKCNHDLDFAQYWDSLPTNGNLLLLHWKGGKENILEEADWASRLPDLDYEQAIEGGRVIPVQVLRLLKRAPKGLAAKKIAKTFSNEALARIWDSAKPRRNDDGVCVKLEDALHVRDELA